MKQIPKQTIWEAWFYVSAVLFIVVMLAGFVPGSKQAITQWPLLALVATTNLLISIGVGLTLKVE